MRFFKGTLIAFVLCLAQPVSAGPFFEDGFAAYIRKDYATTLKLWRPLAEQGYGRAQFYLGFIHAHGYGVPQNYAEALKWYRKAADQGDAKAQNNLGGMYSLGYGVPQNHVQAHMWFNLAAAKGDKQAFRNRDIAAKKMTPAQIAEAQKLAEQCLRRKYKGC